MENKDSNQPTENPQKEEAAQQLPPEQPQPAQEGGQAPGNVSQPTIKISEIQQEMQEQKGIHPKSSSPQPSSISFQSQFNLNNQNLNNLPPEQKAAFNYMQQIANMNLMLQQQKINPMMANMAYPNMMHQINSSNSTNQNQNMNNINPSIKQRFSFQGNNYMNNSEMEYFNNFFAYHNERNFITQKKYTSENLKTEYLTLKTIDHDNHDLIKQRLQKFENFILLPLYQQINKAIKSKRSVYSETFAKYQSIIKKTLTKFQLENSIVQAYGSLLNNFLIDDGDIDICIVPDKITIEDFSIHLDDIKKEIVGSGLGSYVLSHLSPRYSLLKVVDLETDITIDITVHTKLPIYNTRLIRLYSLYDQRFHIMGIYVKHWVKRNKINHAKDKFLSSYALLLMIIHFLQNVVKPSVLPVLQKVENVNIDYEYSHSDTIINCNVYFEEDMQKVKNYMKIINNNTENTESVTELLVQFFEYYAYNYKHDYLISISNSEKKLSSSEHIAFPIEDPFDIEHNPGKSMKLNTSQYDMFLNCMKKEINVLLSGDYLNNNSYNNSHQYVSYNSD